MSKTNGFGFWQSPTKPEIVLSFQKCEMEFWRMTKMRINHHKKNTMCIVWLTNIAIVNWCHLLDVKIMADGNQNILGPPVLRLLHFKTCCGKGAEKQSLQNDVQNSNLTFRWDSSQGCLKSNWFAKSAIDFRGFWDLKVFPEKMCHVLNNCSMLTKVSLVRSCISPGKKMSRTSLRTMADITVVDSKRCIGILTDLRSEKWTSFFILWLLSFIFIKCLTHSNATNNQNPTNEREQQVACQPQLLLPNLTQKTGCHSWQTCLTCCFWQMKRGQRLFSAMATQRMFVCRWLLLLLMQTLCCLTWMQQHMVANKKIAFHLTEQHSFLPGGAEGIGNCKWTAGAPR